MKSTRRVLTASLFCWLVWSAFATSAAVREPINLNNDWEFALEGQVSRRTVSLPHTWNASDSADKRRSYFRGVGRYTKTLAVPESLGGRVLYLYFEGANQVANIQVNGRNAGSHVGGYSAFALNVTPHIKPGSDNELVVTVDNRHNEDIPPLNADFTFYGGIYRDVWLLPLESLHFAIDEYAATDLVVSPTVDPTTQATVNVSGSLRNAESHRRDATVHCALLDPEGATLAQQKLALTVDGNDTRQSTLAEFQIDHPRLWSPESPTLYQVTCSVSENGEPQDVVSRSLGLRWFRVDAETGFHLNGRPYRLYGTNRHQDYQGRGNALPNRLHRTDLERIKSDGFNFLRLAHYPQDPAVLHAADELGLIVWEEIPLVNLISPSDAHWKNATRMVREMVRQHRHHASVVFWGLMNEIHLRRPEQPPDGYDKRVLALANHLNDVVKGEDPSRVTGLALSRDELSYVDSLGHVTDVLALNLYFGWYYEAFDTLGTFLDDFRHDYPNRPLFISEYGAGSDHRILSREPVAFDFSVEYQQLFHEENFRQILDRPWLIGSAVWSQFDFGSNHRQDTQFAINQKGLWSYDRVPKDVAYYYRARLSDEPMLHIAARDSPRRAGSRTGDRQVLAKVYSNLAEVELLVNGQSQGARATRNGLAMWPISLAVGDNQLVAVSGDVADTASLQYEDRSSLFDAKSAPSTTARALAVNVGGDQQVVAASGLIYEADRPYQPGSWGHVSGEAARVHRRILDTLDDPILQSQRRGEVAYRFDVLDGNYQVSAEVARLEDSENDWTLSVNDSTLKADAVAPFRRRGLSVKVDVSDGNGIRVTGDFLNALCIERLVGDGRKRQCAGTIRGEPN